MGSSKPSLIEEKEVRTVQAQQSGEVDIWVAPGFGSIQLHRGRKVNQTYPRHWHDDLYLGAIEGGRGFLEYGGTRHATPRGTLMIVPPGEIHANQKEDCAFRCLFVPFEALQTTVEHFTEQEIPSITFRGGLIEDPQTFAKLVEVHRLLDSANATLASDSAVAHFLTSLVTSHSTTGVPSFRGNLQERAAVLRARKYLEEHFADRVTLQVLARLTRLSPFHLNRSFCRQIGMPPHAYQIQVRISRAKSLLRSGRGISETASTTGFVDQSHFSRQFKKFVGVTPGQFLR